MDNEVALTGITSTKASIEKRSRVGAVMALLALIVGSACEPEPVADVLIIETDSDASLTESGGSARLTVALGRRPVSDVTVPIVSGDPTEGRATPAQLTFTPDNWAAPQEVTVTGVNDDVVDGPVAFRVLVGPTESHDLEFAGLTGESAEFTTIDDDSAGVIVMASDTTTSEGGESGSFRVSLAARPSAEVVIEMHVSDPNEAQLAPSSLTFAPHNWNAVQVVTVTGLDDDASDGDKTFTVEFARPMSADSDYAALAAPEPISFTNSDDDSAAIRVSAVSGMITETGGTATFTVVLQTRPAADVTIGVESANVAEATVAPEMLVFTPESWATAQTVTITGVDDSVEDGNQEVSIQFSAPQTTDAGYAALAAPASITVVNTDDDSPGIMVGEPSGSTGEAGVTATVTVSLAVAPSADVVIDASVSDATEAISSPAQLVFTTENWSEPQTITLTGVDDIVSDGDQPYVLEFSAPTSSDTGYAALAAPADVEMINVDDDGSRLLRTTYVEGGKTFYVVHSWYHTMITTLDDPALPAADARWLMVPGLADPSDPTLVSFVPEGYPDHYMRVDSQSPNGYPPCDEASIRGWALCWVQTADRHHLAWIHQYQDTDTFRRDATFRMVPASSGNASQFSLQWYGEPDSTRFIRHRAYQVFATPLMTATDQDEATFSLEPIPE